MTRELETTLSAAPPPVRKRTVFYLSGFDPKGASHYHKLYKDEAARQAAVIGVPVEVGPRSKTDVGNASWSLKWAGAGGEVRTSYVFLRWDDIVRAHWPRTQPRLWWDIFATTWLNLRHGVLWRMFTLAWPPTLALTAPFVLLSAMLLGMPLLAAVVFSSVAPKLGALVAALLALAAAFGWFRLGRWFEAKYSMWWLMRSYAFTARQAQGRVPELDERLERHADLVRQCAQQGEDDEILLVGHSSGTMMATSVLAKALRQDLMLARHGPTISLLTLGHCMPMLGCLPQAHAFRRDLALLAQSPGIDWVDFTAPPDGCCFALVDPMVVCGVTDVTPLRDRPKMLSPRFAQMFEPGTYAALRRDKFRVHFQYLLASALPVDYNYFAITAGDLRLGARFASHAGITDYAELRPFRTAGSSRRRQKLQ